MNNEKNVNNQMKNFNFILKKNKKLKKELQNKMFYLVILKEILNKDQK